jgi:ectoine hydroxylase-related dioxygenase (phytanoyl-CoA dioxygenase family)
MRLIWEWSAHGQESGDLQLELGPTEFVVGSHCMEPDVAMNEVGSAVSAVLGMGDILLYDYRICHRVR